MDIAIVPAAEQDFLEMYGHRPEVRIRAYALRVDGHARAIGGVFYSGQNYAAFSRVHRPIPKRSLVQLVRKVKPMIKRGCLAIRDASEPTSCGLLEHLGFQKSEVSAMGGEIWAVP